VFLRLRQTYIVAVQLVKIRKLGQFDFSNSYYFLAQTSVGHSFSIAIHNKKQGSTILREIISLRL
jgi:hypothetical protein